MDSNKRDLLKKSLIGTTGVVVASQLPGKWSKPVIESVVVPAHAETSECEPFSVEGVNFTANLEIAAPTDDHSLVISIPAFSEQIFLLIPFADLTSFDVTSAGGVNFVGGITADQNANGSTLTATIGGNDGCALDGSLSGTYNTTSGLYEGTLDLTGA